MPTASEAARRLANEGRAHLDAGRAEAAEAAFRGADALFPDTPAVLLGLGMARAALGDDRAAEADLRRALALIERTSELSARIEGVLGQLLLARGDYGEGFARFDRWRETAAWAGQAAPDLGPRQWDGGDLRGRTLLVWGEQGLGDQIMYARFARQLAAGGARIVWVAPAPLRRLFQAGLDIEAIGPDGLEGLAVDAWLPSSRLPLKLVGAGPSPEPYLKAPPPVRAPGRTVGVMTHGNQANLAGLHRSLSTDAAARLQALPGAVSLAPDDTGARDLHDTAAVVAGLDLVISVDTAVAHLAAALGKPVWLLLPAAGVDWRWGPRGETSAWYRTMRLFRQPRPGDWASVLDEVSDALAARPA